MKKINIDKVYEPAKCEDRIYERWEASGFFNPDNLPLPETAPVYTIILPPPNITDKLHLGHAAMLAIEDLFIRYKRMSGWRTLWLPGTDHAAIATQTVVEKNLKKLEHKTRHDLGRALFLEKVREFLSETQATILRQTKKMGASLDWSRLSFTLDEERQAAVKEMFVQMYEAGLIYRGERIVNWCPNCRSTLADDEVDYKEQLAKLYTFKYAKNCPISISTTRPETKLGDTAIAINPHDKENKQYIGKVFDVDFCGIGLSLKVISDDKVDSNFGTGALGVTPAHSMVDWQMAEKNDLLIVKVINEDGVIEINHQQKLGHYHDYIIKEGFYRDSAEKRNFDGLTVIEAREKIVNELKKRGLLEKEEDISNNLSLCYRCGTAIEPLPSKQWFIAVDKPIKRLHNKSLKQSALEAGEKIEFIPERFTKRYRDWLENLRDWCISRQIWFGHQMPVWYDISDFHNKEGDVYFKPGSIKLTNEQWDSMDTRLKDRSYPVYNNNNNDDMVELRGVKFDVINVFIQQSWFNWDRIIASIMSVATNDCTAPRVGDKNNSKLEFQDSDTLDTWFSSGMWTFSTLGWPGNFKDGKKTGDLAKFHPTQVLETGYEIITLWVSRMVMMSLFAVGEIPFAKVYLHGLVLDKQGKKMSKSKGNGIDPVAMAELYGADAVRLSLLIGNTPGVDCRISEEKIASYRNFTNKFWNITRFITTQITEAKIDLAKPAAKTLADSWILEAVDGVIANVSLGLENYSFSSAGEQLEKFTWHDLADWYLEIAKIEGDKSEILNYILNNLLKLWHPFMPFITENLWQEIYGANELLMIEAWPKAQKAQAKKNLPADMATLQALIVGIRAARSANKLEPVQKITAIIYAGAKTEFIEEQGELIKRLRTGISDLTVRETGAAMPEAIFFSASGLDVYLMAEVNEAKEKARLEKEFVNLEEYITGLEARLAKQEFAEKAPAQIIEQEQKKLAQAKNDLQKIMQRLQP